MIVFLEYTKESMENLLQNQNFVKEGIKINMQKSI